MPTFSFNPVSRETRAEQFKAYLRAMSEVKTLEQAQAAFMDSIKQWLQQIEKLGSSSNQDEQRLAQRMMQAKDLIVGEPNEKLWKSVNTIGHHTDLWTESTTVLDWVYAFNTDQKNCERFEARICRFFIDCQSMRKV